MSRPLTLADLIEAMADGLGDRTAVSTVDHRYGYAEIDERATRFANHLIGLGVRPGEHVAIHATNGIEWVDAFYGCFKARAVPINVNYKYRHAELAHLYGDADCVAAVVGPEYVDAVRELDLPGLRHLLVIGEEYDAAMAAASTERPAPGRTGDDRYLIYTGGTTGKPKGVVWRQEDLLRGALNAARYGAPLESIEQLVEEARGNENSMVLLACGPMMHGGSQWIMGNAHVAGQTAALYTRKDFDAAAILDLVEAAGVVSLTFLGDAMGRPVAEAILAEPDRWDLSSLAAVSNGAAPLSEGVREQIRRALPGKFILDSYGASETGATASRMDEGAGRTPGFGASPDVEVFGPDLRPAPVGVDGLLGRSGPIPLGYYNDEAKTAATFKEIDGVRWSLPGDFARREADGTITLLGRGSVCINTGGEKVHPEEVEEVLVQHPAVFDAVVVGLPHERWGQQVTALVQPREGVDLTEQELVDHCHDRLANYKAPKRVFFVDRVPRTPVSKIDYAASLERAEDLLAAEDGVASARA